MLQSALSRDTLTGHDAGAPTRRSHQRKSNFQLHLQASSRLPAPPSRVEHAEAGFLFTSALLLTTKAAGPS